MPFAITKILTKELTMVAIGLIPIVILAVAAAYYDIKEGMRNDH